jgi:16S rRNA (guanine966-N2)-methyltransferase
MNGIRITGGRHKGRRITAPKGGAARFTSAKVREAIFDLIGGVEGLAVLDLYGGAGSFTAECLSRGAASVTTVELDRHRAMLIKKNLASLLLEKDCLVLNGDVRYAVPRLSKQGKRFHVIFADPPYEQGHIAETMRLLQTNRVRYANAVAIFEHSKREEVPVETDGSYEVKIRKYGDTVLTIVRWEHRSPEVT